jgi:hypothetical protein
MTQDLFLIEARIDGGLQELWVCGSHLEVFDDGVSVLMADDMLSEKKCEICPSMERRGSVPLTNKKFMALQAMLDELDQGEITLAHREVLAATLRSWANKICPSPIRKRKKMEVSHDTGNEK